jgi:exosortase D (VPLPA-CTERM-specific)
MKAPWVHKTTGSHPMLDERPVYRIPTVTWVFLVAGFCTAVLYVWDAVAFMANWLWVRPEYSHGLIVPFIAAFLVWQRRDQIERISFTGSWVGTALVVFGAALGAIGKFATIYTIEQYSLFIILYGLVWSLTGRRVFRLLWMPLLIVIFMVPLPDFLYQNFSANLQLISSAIGVWFIRLFGISVFLEGNVIDLGVYKLQVAEACDGLRYLFPLMTIGFLMAFFFKTALWKRILLFLSSIPITILMNSFRVGTIGLMVEHWGVGMAEGFLHDFQGWVVFMASGAIMLVEMMVLARIGSEGKHWRELFGLEFPSPTPRSPPTTVRSIPKSMYAAVAALALTALVAYTLPERTEVVPARQTFAQYPNAVGAWSGRREVLESIYLETLMLDDYYLGNFQRAGELPINLYVAWYDSQRGGRSVHSPRSCLPGGGWQVESITQRDLHNVRSAGKTLRVNRVLIRLGSQRQLVYYWFDQRGRVFTNEYMAKWWLFWDAIKMNRSDGALVRLVIPIRDGTSIEASEDQLAQFAAIAVENLKPYIPD